MRPRLLARPRRRQRARAAASPVPLARSAEVWRCVRRVNGAPLLLIPLLLLHYYAPVLMWSVGPPPLSAPVPALSVAPPAPRRRRYPLS